MADLFVFCVLLDRPAGAVGMEAGIWKEERSRSTESSGPTETREREWRDVPGACWEKKGGRLVLLSCGC